jgi:hypothetical protein
MLHEILAVESSQVALVTKATNEVKTQLEKKESLFNGKQSYLRMFGREDPNRNQAELSAIEGKARIDLPLTTSIPEILNYFSVFVADWYNLIEIKERTNQVAMADLIVDGVVLGHNLPATLLLSLENKAKALRDVFLAIPPLPSDVSWEPDPDNKVKYAYKSPTTFDVRTAKEHKAEIIFNPTDKQPGQWRDMEVTSNVGQFSTQLFCGKISSADKSQLLLRLDALIQGLKKARTRANSVPLVETRDTIGDVCMSYVLGPWFDRKTAAGGHTI